MNDELFELFERQRVGTLNVTAEVEVAGGIEENEVPNLFTFMDMCSEELFTASKRFTSNKTANDIEDMTFSWIQCYEPRNVSNRHFNRIFGSYVVIPSAIGPGCGLTSKKSSWWTNGRDTDANWKKSITSPDPSPISVGRGHRRIYLLRIQLRRGGLVLVYCHVDRSFDAGDLSFDADQLFSFLFALSTNRTTIGYGNTAPVQHSDLCRHSRKGGNYRDSHL